MSIRSRAYFVVTALGCTFALYACGSSDSAPPAKAAAGSAGTSAGGSAPSAGAGGGDDSSVAGSSDAGAAGSGDDSGGGAGGGIGIGQLDCTTMPQDAATCGACCGQANPDGKTTFSQGIVVVCGCDAGGDCIDKCPNTCAGNGMAEPDCESCIVGLTAKAACIATFNAKCGADAGCNAFSMCATGCAALGAGGAPPATTAPICSSGFQVPIAQQACADCLGNDSDCCDAFTKCENDDTCKSCAQTTNPSEFKCGTNGNYLDVGKCIGNTCKDQCK